MAKLVYKEGLQAVSSKAYAYMQPDGGWGWSNAGLIAGKKSSLLVDTLFDLPLTRKMLEAIEAKTKTPIGQLVNTHHNGDHCYGNELVTGAEIIAHRACRDEMAHLPPAGLQMMMKAWEGTPEGRYAKECFSDFDFNGITLTLPTRVFEDRLTLEVDGSPVELIFLGPAHTGGDIIVHFPEENVVFTGDLLFHKCTPIMWDGTGEQWMKALDAIIALNAEVVVPGHGPLANNEGVQAQKDYFIYLSDHAKELFDRGVPLGEAVKKIDMGVYADWGESERVAANVMRLYQIFSGETETAVDYRKAFQMMAEIHNNQLS